MINTAQFKKALGIIFSDVKAASAAQPINLLPPSPHYHLAVDWAEPLVQVGDQVLKGQKIADGRVAAHAPTSGFIKNIAETATGFSIQLEADGKDAWQTLKALTHYQQLPPANVLVQLHEAGIVGMGGAGFPLTEKLFSAQNKTIHTVIINGVECEPYISADEALMHYEADTIVAGVRILQWLCQATRCVIVINENKTAALRAMQQALNNDSDIECITVENRYPAGHEQQLIQAVCGIHIKHNELPTDHGVLCHNVATAFAVAQAVLEGKPLISRVVTVNGGAVNSPQNFHALIGTPIHHLLTAADWQPQKNHQLTDGGPLTGTVILDTEQGIKKTTLGLIANTVDEIGDHKEQPCIRCGFCVDVCPQALLPQQLLAFSQSHNEAALERHKLHDCIECAACEVVCPSHIPLVDYFSASKNGLMEAAAEQQKARWAEARFVRHQQRKALLEAEKEAKRVARTLLLKTELPLTKNVIAATENTAVVEPLTPATIDPVEAALARARAKRGEQETVNKKTQETATSNDEAMLLRQRINSLTTKLASVEGPAKAVIEQTLEKMQQQLAALLAQPGNSATAETTVLPTAEEHDDPVAAALARARAKRAPTVDNKHSAEPVLDEKTLLIKRIQSLQEKLATAQGPARDVIEKTLNAMQQQLDTLNHNEDGQC